LYDWEETEKKHNFVASRKKERKEPNHLRGGKKKSGRGGAADKVDIGTAKKP